MKRTPTVNNGVLHSPFFIFLRAANRITDSQILHLLGLGNFVRTELVEDWNKPHIYVTCDEEWIHIADDWRYSLWHKGQKQIVERLHDSMPERTIFACMVGDSDESFGFEYYTKGRLLRRIVVEDKYYDAKRRSVVEEVGDRLPPEKGLLETGEISKYVLSIAAWAGVKINHDLSSIRCYSVPKLVH